MSYFLAGRAFFALFLLLGVDNLLGFNLAKQGSVVIFSTVAGGMYASMGFRNTYIFLAASVLIITLISVFTLTNDKKLPKLPATDNQSAA